MLNSYDTEERGLRVKEICFYSGKDVGTDVFINIPNSNLLHFIAGKETQVHDIYIILNYTNTILRLVYDAHNNLTSATEAEKIFVLSQNKNIANYYLGIQTVISSLHKVLLNLLRLTEIKYTKEKNIFFSNYERIYSIEELFEKEKNGDRVDVNMVWKKLIPSPDSEDLVRIITLVNSIYNSFNMFTGFGQVGEEFPTVIVKDAPPSKEYSFTLHNHSLPQIIAGFNNYLSEIKFFD